MRKINLNGIEVVVAHKSEMEPTDYRLDLETIRLKGLVFVGRFTKDELLKMAGYDKLGVWDTAVPQAWFDDQKQSPSLNNVVWFYPTEGPNHLFGKPLYVLGALEEECREEILKQLVDAGVAA